MNIDMEEKQVLLTNNDPAQSYRLIIKDSHNVILVDNFYKTWILSYNGIINSLITLINQNKLLTYEKVQLFINHLMLSKEKIKYYLIPHYDPFNNIVYDHINSARIFESINNGELIQAKVISFLRFITNTRWEILLTN